MKKGILFLAALMSAAMAYGQNPEYLPEWKEGYLDIHTIATGRGDAALIIMPDGTTMMIDAGDNAKAKDTQHPDATKKPGEWQAIYIKHFLKQLPDKENLDYAMVTHLHNDHIGTIKDASINSLTGHILNMIFRQNRRCSMPTRASCHITLTS